MGENSDFCRRRKISRLELFGSALGDDFNSESDFDFLVEFRAGTHPTFQALSDAEAELGQIVGRPVDLVSRRGIEQRRNWLRRKIILESAKEIYAEG